MRAPTIVTMQNGIPWWYFYKHGGQYEGKFIPSADPGGVIARHINAARVIGSVVYPAANLVAPGVVEVVEGNRFGLGELDGSITPRVQAISASLIKAGLKAPIISDIRSEIWLKLWGKSLSFNPISALTHATLEEICQFLLTRSLATRDDSRSRDHRREARRDVRVGLERRIAGAERVGPHKTSTICRTSRQDGRSSLRRWWRGVDHRGADRNTHARYQRGLRLREFVGEDAQFAA